MFATSFLGQTDRNYPLNNPPKNQRKNSLHYLAGLRNQDIVYRVICFGGQGKTLQSSSRKLGIPGELLIRSGFRWALCPSWCQSKLIDIFDKGHDEWVVDRRGVTVGLLRKHRKSWGQLKHCWQDEHEALMKAVSKNGLALRHASLELRGDHEIVMTAVSQKGRALQHASLELRGGCQIEMIKSIKRQKNLDAAFLLTVGSFLLTVELSYLQLTILAFFLQLELFCLQF